jgi:hypothetical protein
MTTLFFLRPVSWSQWVHCPEKGWQANRDGTVGAVQDERRAGSDAAAGVGGHGRVT